MRAVIKFGGSIFAPDKVDEKLIRKAALMLKTWSEKHDLAVVVGGGKISREYGKIGRNFTQDEDLLDLIGIMAARANASLLIAALDEKACPEIPRGEQEFLTLSKKYPEMIIVSGGFRPGQRTDAVAVEIAEAWGADIVVKGTNVDYVYDKDPKKGKGAKPVKEISFEDLEKMVNVGKYEANAPTIMDRTAAELLLGNRIRVAIVRGSDLDNIGKILDGKGFKGTRVGF